MHGIETIIELNNLAYENSPEVIAKRLADAGASREGKISPLEVAMAEHQLRAAEQKAKALANLAARSNEELISLAHGHNANPSTLELALANRLEEVCKAFGIYRPGRTEDSP